MKGKSNNAGQSSKFQQNSQGRGGFKPNKGGKNQAILSTGNVHQNTSKKVTFNQNRQSSQENMSSDRYSSMNSKSYSNNNPVQNNDITHTLDSQEIGMSSKKFSVQNSDHANTLNQFNSKEHFSSDYNGQNVLSKQNSKDSKKSKQSSSNGPSGGDGTSNSYGNQADKSSRRSSQNRVLNSRDLQVNDSVDQRDINDRQISVTYVEQQSECQSAQYSLPPQNGHDEVYQVNLHPQDPILDQFTDLNQLDSVYEYDEEQHVLFAKRQNRIDQMQKRLRILEERHQQYMEEEEEEEESNIQSEVIDQKPDSSQIASIREQAISDPTDNVSKGERVSTMIEEEIPLHADMSARGQDEDASEIRNEEENTVQILIPPTEQNPEAQVQKQVSINSRKKVCISEEPYPQSKHYDPQTHGASQAQSDGTFLSVSSFDEKFGYGKPGTDKQEQEQGSNKSIISEQDSQYEECTPAANKEFHGDFSTQLEQHHVKNLKKTDPHGISKPESHLKQRGLYENKKSMSINGNNTIIDDPKAKPVRTQTMGKQPDTKNRLQHESPGTKSKGGFTNLDQDSMKSLKFISNKGGKRGKKKYVSQKKRDSAIGSGFNHTEKINIVNMNYKKQGTQDERKRGEEGGRDSRNNSLNLTVDNQLDQLSINFGAQKFGYQHFNKQESTERPSRKHDSVGKERPAKGTFSVFSSSNMNKDATPRDYILARSKKKIDPHSNQRFKRQISNDSRYKSPRHVYSPARKQDQTGHDKSNKSVMSGAGNGSASEFYHSSIKNKQKEDLIGIYMKKPYKVMSIKQIKQREQRDHTNVRLFQAENNLKIHTGYNSNRYNQKSQRITSQNEQRDRQALHKNLSPSQALLKDNTSRGKTRDSQGIDSSYKMHSRRSNQRLNRNQYIYQNNQAAHISQMSKETDGKNSSINAQYGKVSPLSNHEITGENTTESKSQLYMNYSTGGQPKPSKVERQFLEAEFKIRFYDNLLYQMDKQQDAIKNQLKSLQTKKNLCNVYGQTFSPIDYGNASYAPHSPQLQNNSRSPKQDKKARNMQNDILKPLGQELRQKNSQQMKTEGGSCDDQTNVKLYLSNVNDFMMNEQIIAESARVKKEIVVNEEPIKPISPRRSMHNKGDQDIRHREMPTNTYETSRDYNQSNRRSEEIGFQQIIEEYDMNNIQNAEQLMSLLDISSTMGYSHQQIKHLKEKHYRIKQLELSLHHLVMKVNRQRVSNSAKKEQQTLPFKKQLTGHSYDIAKSKKQQRHIQKLSFDRDIKSYYPEPNENPSRTKDYKQKEKPTTGTQQKQSMIQMNKESYAKKVNTLMYGSQNIGGTRSNDNSALGAMSKRTQPTGTKGSVEQDEINIQDYIGNKINLRRSIEQMNYDTKQFKRNTRNDQIDLKQELMSEQQKKKSTVQQQLSVNINLSEPSKHSRANTMTKVVNTVNQKGKTNFQYNSSFEKPKFDFIKQNRKNIMPFAENQANFDPDIKRTNVGLFTPNQTSQLPNIIASSRQSINLKNQHGQNLLQHKKSQFHNTQNVLEEVRTSKLVAEIKKGSQDSRVIEKLKNAENQVRDNTYNNQRFHQQKAAYNTTGQSSSDQKPPKGGSDFKPTPMQDSSPPMRKQRSKLLQDNKGSKTRLIQSGQHIISQPTGVQGITSSVTNPQSTNSNTQLGYQFKNISPRFPGFKNNLHELQKKSSDLQNAIESMQIDEYKGKTRQPPLGAATQGIQNPNNNILASSDYSHGKQIAQATSKQTQILRGVLNQQRRLNRIIQNQGVIGNNSTARVEGNTSVGQKHPNTASISHQSSSIASHILGNSSIGAADSYNMNPHLGKHLSNNRSINQSVNNPIRHPNNRDQGLNDNNSNTFTTLDPLQNNILNQEQQQNLDYIQQIQSGVHNVMMPNEVEITALSK